MADDDIVEIAAVIGSDGATPVPVTEKINDHVIGLMRVVKTYEKYAVKAAITGDDDYAIKGLLVHPLVGDYEKTVKCFNELKEAHKEFLPQYFNK
jgi:6-phospho-beta-glucosidase